MKFLSKFVLAAFVAGLVLTPLHYGAGVAAPKPPESKSRFLIIAPHTPEECLKVLDDTELKSQKLLGKFDWGCMAGDHTGYAIVEGTDEAAVKEMLPASMQNARIVKLNKFTAAEIKSFHGKK